MTAYRRFLEAKIKLDPGDGIEVDPARLNPALKLFTQASVRWLLRGGRRALFSSFGLHKTVTQLEVMRLAPVDVPRSILAPMVLQRMITRVGEWAVGEALKVLAETRPDGINVFRSPTVAAMCRIAAAKPYSGTRWRAAVKSIDMGRFYVDVVSERATGGGTLESAAERVLRRAEGQVSI